MPTIHAVSIEDMNSGAVDWFREEADAARHYADAVQEFPDQEINRYSFEVGDSTDADSITDEADARMWERDYEPIESHRRGASVAALIRCGAERIETDEYHAAKAQAAGLVRPVTDEPGTWLATSGAELAQLLAITEAETA